MTKIDVELTEESVIHCFRLKLTASHDGKEVPIEINMHTRQAFELFGKLGETLMEYFARESATLLNKIGESHEARRLLEESEILFRAMRALPKPNAHARAGAAADAIGRFLRPDGKPAE